MPIKYFMIQCQVGDKWANYSCRYFLTPIEKVLLQYVAFRHMEPNKRFRIVKGYAEE